MGTTSTNLTITIITKTTGEDELLLEAEIVESDNDGQSTYYVNETYYLRLFKSLNIVTLTKASNVGTLSLKGSGLTCSVPYEGEDDEYITFTGEETADLSKVYESSLSYTQIGSVFDANGNSTSVSLTAPAKGAKTVTANKAIFGVFKVTYVTKYDKYSFSSPQVGPMLILFIGSDT